MAHILTPDQILLSKKLIQDSNRIIITSHRSPDGDAVGSALAMHNFLVELGKKPLTILPDSAPDFLQWMIGYGEILIFDQNPEKAKQLISEADLIFSLDYNHLARVGQEMQSALENTNAKFLMIDHHQQPAPYPVMTYSDTSACSTCEMVFRFIEQCGWVSMINLSAAECIYCGIMTDSGSFRFHSVTADTHRIVGSLIENGLDHAEIHRKVYDTNLMDKLKLIGYALSEKLEVMPESNAALIYLDKNELSKYNYRQGDTEGLVNQALSIKNIKLAAFFREGANEIKASFRSKGSFDVNAFARKYWNGGGHMNAAGGISLKSMPETIALFKEQILAMQEEIKNS